MVSTYPSPGPGRHPFKSRTISMPSSITIPQFACHILLPRVTLESCIMIRRNPGAFSPVFKFWPPSLPCKSLASLNQPERSNATFYILTSLEIRRQQRLARAVQYAIHSFTRVGVVRSLHSPPLSQHRDVIRLRSQTHSATLLSFGPPYSLNP